MPQVETLRGPVDTSQLGFTLMHEHVFVLTEGLNQTYPKLWDEETRTVDASAGYATNILACETCVRGNPANHQACLNAIHS